MICEAGVVVDKQGFPIYWHVPPGRTVASLPDSSELWEVLWRNRDRLGGFAHTHPGSGLPGPSEEDLTTFAAIEAALGRRLDWYIASADLVIRLRWQGSSRYRYHIEDAGTPSWTAELRRLSEGP